MIPHPVGDIDHHVRGADAGVRDGVGGFVEHRVGLGGVARGARLDVGRGRLFRGRRVRVGAVGGCGAEVGAVVVEEGEGRGFGGAGGEGGGVGDFEFACGYN